MTQKKIAVYPGSFDPITFGHLDIINRALKIFDEIIIAVARNDRKSPLFTVEERVDLIKSVIKDSERARVDTFEGLLVDYARSCKAQAIVRGLRAISDFEYELQMAQINRGISREVETVFLMTSVFYSFLSSSIVKEVHSLQGPIDGLVPPLVKKALDEKFKK
ncbi:MAG: pantetheine-phosphate adenylyltransferase [Deltaproteobacteria bacterium]|nr:pantetheine-phosphate adenylyltransferase [Deltaproteobacteria bacterium]